MRPGIGNLPFKAIGNALLQHSLECVVGLETRARGSGYGRDVRQQSGIALEVESRGNYPIRQCFLRVGCRNHQVRSALADVAAQVPYYAAAALALGAPDREVAFSVPTGNFGNVLATAPPGPDCV